MNALELFRKGHDTQQIADLLHIKEHEVYNEIARATKAAPHPRKPSFRPLIPYAGSEASGSH